jgi:predicted nucleotidyltransferase
MINPVIQKKYFARAFYWANILGRLPGVRAIFLSGSLARGDGNDKSDIDFFVIVRHGQIWTARFFVFVMLKLSGRLAKPHHHAGQICPNHFITDKNLTIQEQDAYAARLFSSNQALYDPDQIFLEFVSANETWIKKFGCKFENKLTAVGANNFVPKKNLVETKYFLSQKKTNQKLNWIEGWFESFIRPLQIKKIRSNSEYDQIGAKIILTDHELRFHPEPKNR